MVGGLTFRCPGGRAIAVVLAFALAAAVATAPAGASTLIVPSGTGLTQPTGIAVTADGELWALDLELGLCRVSALPADPHMNEDSVCRATRNIPAAAGQLAFDPATANFYAADGKANAGGVWRMHWNAATGTIDDTDLIFNGSGSGIRVVGLALGPTGDLDFTAQGDQTIRRITAPASGSPGAPEPVGFSRFSGAQSLAYVGTTLYIAESSLSAAGTLSRLLAPAPLAGTAEAVPGQPGGLPVTALAGDSAHGRLYIGTATGGGADPVLVLEGGAFHEYDPGHAGVTALWVDATGRLVIADDPLNAVSGQDSIARSRVFSEPFGPADPPRVTITSAPAPRTTVQDAHFAFTASAGASTQCRVDGGDWVACAATFVIPDIAEGSHSFEVRAIDGADPSIIGAPTGYGFTVDRTAPVVAFDNPPEDRLTGASLVRVRFSADEASVRFTCAMNDEPAVPCTSPRTYADPQPGDNRVRVWATDRAGNHSEPATWDFTIPGGARSADPTSSGGPIATASSRTDGCRTVALGADWALLWIRDGRLRVSLQAPDGARFVKLSLRHAAGRKVIRTYGFRTVPSGAGRTLHVVLSRNPISGRQWQHLREGRQRVTVGYGTCRTRLGATRVTEPLGGFVSRAGKARSTR